MKTLLIFLIFLLSCSDNTKIRTDLELLYSVPIVIPNNLSVTFNGKDSIFEHIFDSKLKFIIYVDSLGCTSCNIDKMYLWNSYLNYLKTLNNKLKFYYIFNPAKNNSSKLRITLLLNPLNYPVLIDLNGDFEKLNPHLPKNKAMHTFLLDENNRVILVGNPLYNKEIEKLFYKKTQELLSK